MKRIFYYLALCLIFPICNSCSKNDNYPAPSETLTGVVIDKATQKPVLTEVGDGGFRIKLLEKSWNASPTPFYFYGMQDGTFNNTKVFKGDYNISVEGAFVPLVQYDNSGNITLDESQIKTITGTVKLTFSVEPFLNVEWVDQPVVNANGSVTAKVKFTRGTTNANFLRNITDVYLFVNSSSYVGNNNFDNRYSTKITYSGSAANSLLGQTVTITTTGVLPASRTYYIRVGARIDYDMSGKKRYNYNEVKSVAIP